MFDQAYALFFYILLGEVILVICLIFIFFIERLAFFFQRKKSMREEHSIEVFILDWLKHKELNLDQLAKGKYAPRHMLKILERFDRRLKGNDWCDFKQHYVERFLSIKATEWITSRFWRRRYFSAKVFAMCPQPADEIFIHSLLLDSHFMIRCEAARVAIALENPKLIALLLDQMNSGIEYLQIYFRDLLRQSSSKGIEIIARLSTEPRYHIPALIALSGRFLGHHVPDIKADLISDDFTQKFFALEILMLNPIKEGEQSLFKLAKDTSNAIKKKAIMALASYNTFETLTFLKDIALSDEAIDLRFEAIKSIRKLKKEKFLLDSKPPNQVHEILNYLKEFDRVY
ncbi:MAG: HEAT repeat domain-containing protein [Simkaniaceae bacterium]|nr:HEAT repeat domain-containing protein [Simkaniaceae bacterium]